MEETWNEIDEHLSVIAGNLGICCQEYCDAPNAIHSMERVMELLVDIKEKIEKNYYESRKQIPKH